jgi:anthranilate phosphoribosyltransferase
MAGQPTTWPTVLRQLLTGSDLSDEQARWALDTVLAGNATEAQIAGFLIALRAKGESAAEVNVFVEVMLAKANIVRTDRLVLDVVGTGGDHSNSVNISTMSALVAAAAGAPIVKHGNRAASSATGTADVLEELGVRIALAPEAVAACASEVGIGFCFAPAHHPAARFAAQVRRDLGVPTIFNTLGPLMNPALAEAALVGCADAARAPLMAQVLDDRGVAAIVVRGEDGMDEISLAGPTRVWDATAKGVVESVISPQDVGIAPQEASLLVGGDRVRNAELLRKALAAPDASADADVDAAQVAAIRDAIRLNASAALVAYEAGLARRPTADAPLSDRMKGQLPRVEAVLADGSALQVLDRWARFTGTFAD